MQVKELRELLADMPGEMCVYVPEGSGLMSVQHTFRANLVGVEQYCELLFFGMNEHRHTPQFQDGKIERETGFKDRDELIAAYKRLQSDKTVCPFHHGTVTDATKCICD